LRNIIAKYVKKRGFTKKKNKEYQEEQMKTLERIHSIRDSRKFYCSLQESKWEFKSRVTICRKRNGDIATGKDEVITQWKEYFQDALSGDIGEEVEDYPYGMNMNVGLEEEPPPSLEEVLMAVKCLNNNQSHGTDGISTELYKRGGTKLLQYIHSIVTDVLMSKY
jgi:hypothetical protein